ncbi:hypothetical protein [Radicibacter daui]|uniref:hypothetical protein n=1 Tax=Radicibacter daui TaxID=3064829 RepID=UPI004046D9E2
MQVLLLAGLAGSSLPAPASAQSAGGGAAGTARTQGAGGDAGKRTAAAETLQEVRHLIIWDSPTHMRDRLRLDTALTQACRDRQFNQRYLMLYRARFAEIYQVGVAWMNPAILSDPNGYATRNQIYYFFHDGGWDGYLRCEVYVQDIDHDFVRE